MSDVTSKQQWLEDELFMLQDGGEMPEVALHSAIYFLSRDPDGPQLQLEEADIRLLEQGVVGRYQIIILRDLTPTNRFTTIYRGLERSCANWQRLAEYSKRKGIAVDEVRQAVARALVDFLHQEYEDVVRQGSQSSINCCSSRLQGFAQQLQLDLDHAVPSWRQLFD